MAQIIRVLNPPVASQFPITINRETIAGIASVEVDNGSALGLVVTADGATIQAIAPYVARFAVNTSNLWATIVVDIDHTATIQPTDLINIICYDTAVVPPLLPSFGPSAWGGGSDPASLTRINPGDQFLAWQVNQFFDALEGTISIGAIFPTAVAIVGLGGSWSIQLDPSGNLIILNTNTAQKTTFNRTNDNISFPKAIQAQGAIFNVTGSRGGVVALANLMTALASIGLVFDNTTP